MNEKQVVLEQKKQVFPILEKNKKPKKPRRRFSNYPLTQEEVEKLIPQIHRLRDKMLLEIGFNSGMRVSEVVGISLVGIDWENGIIRIWDEKKDKYRNVMLPLQTMNSLKLYMNERKEKTDRIFPFSTKTAENIIQRYTTQILGKTKSWHSVRHTYFTISADLQQNIKIVQENSGDSINTILKYYTHLTPQTRRKLTDEKPIYKEKQFEPV